MISPQGLVSPVIAREPDSVLTIRDWATLASTDLLDAPDYGIRDLTGVEYFVILDELICNNNEITKMDSAQFSKTLVALECTGNQMTELDVSQWGELIYLYCNDNLLTELDLSHNKKLYDLICSDNLLAELDTSQNPDLYFLECVNNRLTGLNLINNPEITMLWCYENYLDAETPGNSILGLEPLLDELGRPLSKDEVVEYSAFVYYPQRTAGTEHSWDSGTVTRKPTCTEKGKMTYTCTDCGITKTGDIAALGHQWGTWMITTEPSLTETGTAQRVCGRDESHKESALLPVLTDTKIWTKGKVVDGCQQYTSIYGTVAIAISSPPPVQPDTPDTPNVPSIPDTPDVPDVPDVPEVPFTDVRGNAWYYDSVSYIYEQGLMMGTDNDHFSPNLNASRAMIASILWRMAGSPAPTGESTYTDCNLDAYYAQAVAWGTENGVLTGYGGGLFAPNHFISREQLAVILYRYSGAPDAKGSLDRFTDGNRVSGYALDALRWAVEKGIISGKGGGILDPSGKATRAEVAAILQRYMTLKG